MPPPKTQNDFSEKATIATTKEFGRGTVPGTILLASLNLQLLGLSFDNAATLYEAMILAAIIIMQMSDASALRID